MREAGLGAVGQQQDCGAAVAVVGVHAQFVHLVEKGGEAVKFFLGNGVKFMVVALGAFHRHAEKGRCGGVNPVIDILQPVFFIHNSAFCRDLVIPVEACGENLLFGGIGQEVSGKLPGHKLVEGHVSPERIDDPVAPGVHGAPAVGVVAVAVGISGHIEPFHCHAFGEGISVEEAVHDFFKCLRGGVCKEGIGFFGAWRQAGKVEVHPAQEPFLIGFRRGGNAFLLEAGQHKLVHRVLNPVFLANLWRFHFFRREESPVFFPFGSLVHPGVEDGFFVGREGEMAFGRGHHQLGVAGENALDEDAVARAAGVDEGLTFVVFGE